MNRVYEIQGLKSATDHCLEPLPAFGYTKVPECEAFIAEVATKGLRATLAEAKPPRRAEG